MSDKTREKYEKRLARYQAAIALETPDRIPRRSFFREIFMKRMLFPGPLSPFKPLETS